MPKKRSSTPLRVGTIPPAWLAFLALGDREKFDDLGDVVPHLTIGLANETKLERFLTGKDADETKAWWKVLRAPLLVAWVKARPGTRPWAWWQHDAPQEALALLPSRSIAHRRRLSAVEDESAERDACAWPFTFGLLDYGMPGEFEAEATFLDRHGLLTDDERRRLPADAFSPEVIEPEDEERLKAITKALDERFSLREGD